MKTMSKTLLMVSLFAARRRRAGGMTHQQRTPADAAANSGAALYALRGDTGSTLGGAALGGVIGSQVRTRR